jgi:hypothetical protein
MYPIVQRLELEEVLDIMFVLVDDPEIDQKV